MFELSQSLSYVDIQHIIAIKFCLIAFLVIGLFFIGDVGRVKQKVNKFLFPSRGDKKGVKPFLYKKAKPWVFLLVTGALSALAYAILVNNWGLLLWGLQGDEITIAAMYNTFIHQGFFSDFGYYTLPPFYPPLFFWIFSLPGRLFNWNGVVAAKFASFIFIFIFPILTYAVSRLYWRSSEPSRNQPGIIAAFLAPLLIFVLIDHSAIIGKPYELLAAMATVYWTAFLLLEVKKKHWRFKQAVIFGLAGGIIFMTYYLWLIFATIAIALAGLWVEKKYQWSFYGRLFSVAVISLIVSLPYLGPLAYSYVIHGTENWQTALFTIEGLAWNMPILEVISLKNIMLFGGFITLVIYRKNDYVRPLLLLFVAAYIWWLMGLVTLFFFQVPIQEFKGFFFYVRTILAIALAFGLERLWYLASDKFRSYQWQPVVMVAGLFFLATNLIFGSFIDSPVVQYRMTKSQNLREEIVPLLEFLQANPSPGKLTLHSGITELFAFIPVQNFIYYNQHNNHPAASFSARRSYVQALSLASSPGEFYDLTQNTPYGAIERMIFFQDQGSYFIFLHLDEPITGVKEEVIAIPASLITEEYFKKIYDQSGFVVWEKI